MDTKFCNEAGWCWEWPTPQGNNLEAMFAVSQNEVWAVGTFGTILRWNGSQWHRVRSNTTENLHGVWASSASDVWIVGGACEVAWFDGANWGTLTGPSPCQPWNSLYSVTGTATELVVGGGSPNTNGGFAYLAQRTDAGGWAVRVDQQLGGAFVSLATQGSTLVAGSDTHVMVASFADGGLTPFIDAGDGTGGNGLAFSADGLWAVGVNLEVRLGSGAAWVPVQAPRPSDGKTFRAVVAWDGGGFAAGDRGIIASLSPSSVTSQWSGTPSGDGAIKAIFATDPNNTHAVSGYQGYSTRAGDGTWTYRSSTPVSYVPKALWGLASGELYAAAGLGFLLERRVGPAFCYDQDLEQQEQYGLWGVGPRDLFIAGVAGLRRWRGEALCTATPAPRVPIIDGGALLDVHGLSDALVYSVGAGGQIYRLDDAGVFLEADAGADLNAVWVFAPDDVWAAGTGGTLLHRNGAGWSQVDGGAGAVAYTSLWGRAPNDLWAAGPGGVVLHWDGVSWARVWTGTGYGFNAMTGLSSNGRVFIAGEEGAVLRH